MKSFDGGKTRKKKKTKNFVSFWLEENKRFKYTYLHYVWDRDRKKRCKKFRRLRLIFVDDEGLSWVIIEDVLEFNGGKSLASRTVTIQLSRLLLEYFVPVKRKFLGFFFVF